jgi:hypothetical protein
MRVSRGKNSGTQVQCILLLFECLFLFCWLVPVHDRLFPDGKFVSAQLLFTNLKLSVINSSVKSEIVIYPFSFSLYTKCL